MLTGWALFLEDDRCECESEFIALRASSSSFSVGSTRENLTFFLTRKGSFIASLALIIAFSSSRDERFLSCGWPSATCWRARVRSIRWRCFAFSTWALLAMNTD